MFGFAKRVSAERAGRSLAQKALDPGACLKQANRLPGRPDHDPIACCEIAFAKAGTLKHVIADTQGAALAGRMNAAVDAAVEETFAGAHTAETRAHYGSEDLREIAARAVAQYQVDGFWADRVAQTLGRRLRQAGRPSAEAARIFTDLTQETVLALFKLRLV
ncbi:MAG: hypothetical protein H0X27_08805 [Caulobacteraceae bacterium]|nr:hypothetical protein [Caulobacteraceae bacterium]